MKRKPEPGLPRLFDRPKYRQRDIIECKFGWLKENRRIVTRFDKLAKSYAAMGMRHVMCTTLLFVQSLKNGAFLACEQDVSVGILWMLTTNDFRLLGRI